MTSVLVLFIWTVLGTRSAVFGLHGGTCEGTWWCQYQSVGPVSDGKIQIRGFKEGTKSWPNHKEIHPRKLTWNSMNNWWVWIDVSPWNQGCIFRVPAVSFLGGTLWRNFQHTLAFTWAVIIVDLEQAMFHTAADSMCWLIWSKTRYPACAEWDWIFV